MVRVLLADTSYLVRKGFITILNEFKSISQITEIATLSEMSEAIQTTSPNLIIINTTLSSIPEVDQLIKKYAPDANIVYTFNTPLPDDTNEKTLSVFDSKSVLITKIRNQVKNIQQFIHQQENSEDLSDREKEVLKKVALGKTNKEVANELFISTHTVISHRKNITRKLGIKTVSGLTVYAILNQLINLEDIS